MCLAHTLKILPMLSFLALSLTFVPAKQCRAADLSQQEAEHILEDTATIASYLGLKGESDYVNKPQNIIMAALFGCYDAKMRFHFEQEQRKEAGKQALPGTTPLFTVNGQSVTADQVMTREDNPKLFKKMPDSCTCFITRNAVTLAALQFTGHTVKKHQAPKGNEFFGESILNDKGYFVSIDGLGDAPTEAVLKKVAPRGQGFLLTGEVIEVLGDPDEKKKPGTFRLELTPGDAPGTWKRQYSEKAPK